MSKDLQEKEKGITVCLVRNMKTKEVIFLLNRMHDEVKAMIIEEQTRTLLAKLSKAIDK